MKLTRFVEELLSGDVFQDILSSTEIDDANAYAAKVEKKYMEEAQANLKEEDDAATEFLKAKRKAALEIIDDANEGKASAINYLYIRYLKLTQKAYWKYYIGNNRKAAAAQGKTSESAQQSFASTAWQSLAGALAGKPVKTFKPELFSLETDLLKQLGGWYAAYIENEAIQKWKKEVRKGLSGKRKQRGFSADDEREAEMNGEPVTNHYSDHGQTVDPLTVSEEDYAREEAKKYATYNDFDEVDIVSYDNTENTRGMEAASAVQSHDEEVEAKILLDEFTNYLSTYKVPMFKKVWDLQREGYSTMDIAEKLNLSPQNTSAYWRRIKALFKEYFGL